LLRRALSALADQGGNVAPAQLRAPLDNRHSVADDLTCSVKCYITTEGTMDIDKDEIAEEIRSP